MLQVIRTSFTSLVFTTNGGMSTETKQFYRRLSQLLCEKSDISYSHTSAWVKRHISFSLLRTSIICIRRSRSKKYNIWAEERMDDVASVLYILVKNYVNKHGVLYQIMHVYTYIYICIYIGIYILLYVYIHIYYIA